MSAFDALKLRVEEGDNLAVSPVCHLSDMQPIPGSIAPGSADRAAPNISLNVRLSGWRHGFRQPWWLRAARIMSLAGAQR